MGLLCAHGRRCRTYGPFELGQTLAQIVCHEHLMTDGTYTDFLVQEAETRTRAKMRGSILRTVLGFAFLIYCGVLYLTSGNHITDNAAFYMVVSGIIAFVTLIGFTPKPLQQLHILANAPIFASPSYQDQSKAIRDGIADGSIYSPKLFDLKRKLHALFLVRMIGVVIILMVVVIWGMRGA